MRGFNRTCNVFVVLYCSTVVKNECGGHERKCLEQRLKTQRWVRDVSHSEVDVPNLVTYLYRTPLLSCMWFGMALRLDIRA